MGARRDDLPVEQRMQIALTVLASPRPHGTVTRLAATVGVSRQTLSTIATTAARVLRTGLVPGPHGPPLATPTIQVDRNRLLRGSVVLTEVGVSQRDIACCLAQLLDTPVSVGWLHAALNAAEHAAANQNAAWQPSIGESRAGDELFSNGAPNLLVVDNDSLYIYTLTRQPTCDGDTWGRSCSTVRPVPSSAAMPGRIWRLSSRPRRWQCIKPIGTICCAACGAKLPASKPRPMPLWRPWRSERPSLTRPTPPVGWPSI